MELIDYTKYFCKYYDLIPWIQEINWKRRGIILCIFALRLQALIRDVCLPLVLLKATTIQFIVDCWKVCLSER